MPPAPPSVLVSAGEASGDRYAALLVEELRRRWPETAFFGCTGPRLRNAGVETVIPSENLAVVGLIEVLAHLPRIYGEYRKLLRAVRERKPALAILTDSPDFHLRVARRLFLWHIPVVYLVAPQVWAWRKRRIRHIRRLVSRLLCIFPFEEQFFLDRRVPARYIGHPLATLARPALSKASFLRKHAIPPGRLLVAILPGSRQGEAARHLPDLLDAVRRLAAEFPVHFLLPASPNTGSAFFRERIGSAPIQVVEGEAWDTMAHSDLALAASGTVTVEAAILGVPMVVFYRVNRLSWLLGRLMVKIPFFSMVNLIAEKQVVPELIQGRMTGRNLFAEAARLLRSPESRDSMRRDLARVAGRLTLEGSPISRAADEVVQVWEEKNVV
ncbi:MAG: lipid-A-disaccharide synthase [Acidobacteriota bacterium]|nr:lipid-A-disaccharide synthase [Acidobacteriota bacterium]